MKKEIPFQTAKHDFTLMIFGASGSLAKLKIFPSIYELAFEGRMPKDYKVVGYARTPMTESEFRDFFEASVRKEVEYVDEKVLKKLLKNVHYVSGQYDEAKDYKRLKKELGKMEANKSRVRIAYFSVPPSAFNPILKCLGEVNFNTRKAPLRLIVEKPFGYDLKSAKKLKKCLNTYFSEDQYFLLDHYLGKEAVSNLLSLRYSNSILTSLMHSRFVDNIQITAMESKDIEGRSNYFDHVGILRDMVQSHLLQILAYLTMQAPKDTTAEAIHKEKTRILKSIKLKKGSLVRGQYKGYRKEKGVPNDSQTETYAALELTLNHPLWKKVPIRIRSGKALKEKWTAVVVTFKPRRSQRDHGDLPPNRLVIQLQPYEKIEFHMLTKMGGKTFDFHEMTTGRPIYCSGDCLSEHGRLFLDVIEGKKDLFLNFDEIFAAWKVIDPLQKMCDKACSKACEPVIYKKGSLGPEDDFDWFNAFPE